MKLVFASDIHGSAYYCEKLLERYQAEAAQKLILLGDILYHGPRNALPRGYEPAKVAEMLNGMRDEILCVRGNCDSEVDQMVLQFPILADYAIFQAGERMIFATHGHHFHNDQLPPLKKGDILLHGHTHVPKCEAYDTHVYLNPGSVSIPKENSPHSYILWEGSRMTWKTLDGDIYLEYEI